MFLFTFSKVIDNYIIFVCLQVDVPRPVWPGHIVHHDDTDQLVQPWQDDRLHRDHLGEHVGRLGQDDFGLALLRHLHVDFGRAHHVPRSRLYNLILAPKVRIDNLTKVLSPTPKS